MTSSGNNSDPVSGGKGISVDFRGALSAAGNFILDWGLLFYGFLLVSFLVNGDAENSVGHAVPVWVGVFAAVELAAVWRCLGESVGSVAGGWRVVKVRGGKASIGEVLRRFFWWHISTAPLLIGHLIRVNGLTLHDRMSGTMVVPREKTGLAVPWYREGWKVFLLLLFLLTVTVGWMVTEVRPSAVFSGIDSAGRIVSGLLKPDLDILVPMLGKMVETVFLAFMATVFALPFAFLLAFPGARNIVSDSPGGALLYGIVRAFFNIARSVEPVAWAIIFAVWVGIGPFAGVLALWIHSVAALGKLYSEQVESIDPGPVEAVIACGAGRLQVIRFAVVPQVLPPFVAFTIYRWDINVRMATIVGFVGGGGIGQSLIQYQQLLRWRDVGMILWLIAAVVWILDYASARLREKII
jgi:phosphonate transport system permease protein